MISRLPSDPKNDVIIRIILASLHQRISYFEPFLLKELTLQESALLKEFWDYELNNVEPEDNREKKYGYDIYSKIENMDLISNELNKELGFYKNT